MVGKINLCRKHVDVMPFLPALWFLIAVLAVRDTLPRYLIIDIRDTARESKEYREARKESSEPRKYMYLFIYLS